MKLSDRYDGSDDPFEGDRTLLLKIIPVGARIERASATVTPIDASRGINPFTETIAFTGTSGDWGATKTVVTTPSARWVEVDFHRRRTLSAVTGSQLTDATLQVDLGGAYVEVNVSGGIKTPSDPNPLTLKSDSEAVPSLTVTKFKLTLAGTATGTPDITQVTIRSTPTNVSLRLGDLPAFWTRPGEMTQPETTPDFTAALQALLASATTENGFYSVPLILHSESITRLALLFEVEFLMEQNVLRDSPSGVVLPFDLSGVAQTRADLLQIEVPPDSRLAESGTLARVTGTFGDTRLVAETVIKEAPADQVEVSTAQSQAQPVEVSEETLVTNIDLLVGVSRTVRLQLDMRENFDGKPASFSLLPAPLEFEVTGPGGAVEKGKVKDEPKWVSVDLPAEFKFKAGKAYWIVLQSVEGEAAWFITPARGSPLSLQQTNDGGLSWRAATTGKVAGPLKAFFRLRRRPQTFEMPIKLQVGEGSDAVDVNLERFQSLGRVDFTLEASDLSEALDKYLDKAAAPACPEIEHLRNGDFEQWLRSGDSLSRPKNITLSLLPKSVAVAPDGTYAYVGLATEGGGVLRVLDVVCNTLRGDELSLPIEPDFLLISPDGTHAFILDNARVQMIDTNTQLLLGEPFNPGAGIENQRFAQVEAVALSPDGGHLYIVQIYADVSSSNSISVRRALHVLDTTRLLEAVAGGRPLPGEARVITADLDIADRVTGLALAPDERLAYLIVDKKEARGELHILETANLNLGGEVLEVGRAPSAIALTPDGKQAVIANSGDRCICLVATPNAARRLPAIECLSVGSGPSAVAVAPDGLYAYVLNRASVTLSYVDLKRRSVLKEIPLAASPKALALTPQGDTLYITHTGSESSPPESDLLSTFQIGLRLPVAWDLTSGWIMPVCLPAPFRQIAILGLPNQQADSEHLDVSKILPTALSQVVPVSADCAYEFSFWAIANEPDAVAEVFWLNSACRLLESETLDRIFIESMPVASARTSIALALFQAERTILERAPLVLHRQRLNAPAGAVQAEIRFSVPPGAIAAVEGVSFMATTEVVVNPDLTLQREGRLVGWQLSPGPAPGIVLVASENGVQFRNASANSAELTQTIPAKSKSNFALEWRGRVAARSSARAKPRVELRWIGDNRQQVGEPMVLKLSKRDFATWSATGVVPAGASEAEMHLVVPAGTAQIIDRVSLRYFPVTSVPISFTAQAPGELTVQDWRVAFERAEVTLPRVPEGTSCKATPPGRTPGAAGSEGDDAFCPHCEAEHTIAEVRQTVTESNLAATQGRCTNCGNEVVRFSGTSAAPLLSALRSSAANPVLHLSGLRSNAALMSSPGSKVVTSSQSFAAIKGIGEVRTKQLAAIGIDSVEALAIAAPEDVARARSIPLALASNFINQAKELLLLNKSAPES
jgi:DNA-binding beta-propeller fold protein YncE